MGTGKQKHKKPEVINRCIVCYRVGYRTQGIIHKPEEEEEKG